MPSNNYIVRVTSGGDFTFGAGLSNYAQNNAAVALDINMNLGMLLGNCFWATNVGIAWWTLLGTTNLTQLSLAINSTILNTIGVVGLLQTNLALDRESRALTITYNVQTQYSTLQNAFVYNVGTSVPSGGVND